MTDGQKFALWQLGEIADAGRALCIEKVKEPNADNSWLRVTVSIVIGSVDKVVGGLDLHEREEFELCISPNFPLQKPEVKVGHVRFAGMPHVQWSRHLCLYRSSSEWNASDGMFGFIDRLFFWLRQGAKNELDQYGEPLHPPAVYADVQKGKLVVPRVDTPVVEATFWLGFASITQLSNRIDIVGWHALENPPAHGEVALAVLFSSPLSWEYPLHGSDFFRQSERQGVSLDAMFRILRVATTLRPATQPTYVIFGSPMRGIAGGLRKQHLSVWALDGQLSDYLQSAIPQDTDSPDVSAIRNRLDELLRDHLAQAPIAWCPVLEARPEVTIRRDRDSVLSYFNGKTVAVWGCGALGAHIALCLARVNVRKIVLLDNGVVSPGILVRQPYEDADIGTAKVSALQRHLLRINPALEIEIHPKEAVNFLAADENDWTFGADAIIDATASDLVRRSIEVVRKEGSKRRVPVASLMIDATATHLVVSVVASGYSGGTWDILRKSKTKLLTDLGADHFTESFFPVESNRSPFQPEPGCSEPTFIGSSSDSMSLSAIALNLVSTELKKDHQVGVVWYFSQPTSFASQKRYEFDADVTFECDGFEIRVSRSALREMKGCIQQNKRLRKSNVETGGLLWGEWDNSTRIVWISSASGPPPDSKHSADFFVCGKVGTVEENEARRSLSRQSIGYIGMWHTHPVSKPLPSGTDYLGMHQILTSGPTPPKQNILMIVGKESGRDTIGIYLFKRIRGDEEAATHEIRVCHTPLSEPIL